MINYVGNADCDSLSPSLLVNVYDYMSGGHIEPGTVVTKIRNRKAATKQDAPFWRSTHPAHLFMVGGVRVMLCCKRLQCCQCHHWYVVTKLGFQLEPPLAGHHTLASCCHDHTHKICLQSVSSSCIYRKEGMAVIQKIVLRVPSGLSQDLSKIGVAVLQQSRAWKTERHCSLT